MALKNLITHQILRIENHCRSKPNTLSGLHIHKTFFNDKHREGWEVVYPLVGDQKPYGRIRGEKMAPEYLSTISKEIGDALEESGKQRQLTDLLGKTLKAYAGSDVTLEMARDIATKMSGYFELDPKIQQELIQQIGSRLLSYTSFHSDPEKAALFVITQGASQIVIGPAGRLVELEPFAIDLGR